MRFFWKIGLVILISIGSEHVVVAQEGVEIRNLQVNTDLLNAKKTPVRKTSTALVLPFFDDFSSLHSPYPNPKLWQNNLVFINATFPYFPPTIGVATFDALDAHGRLYPQASIYPFPADTLTSQPIRLDSIFSPIPRSLFPEDSIFFSFYYQPGGGFGDIWNASRRGHAPVKGDLLILEFFNIFTQVWDQVWSSNGQNLDEFCPLCPKDTLDKVKTYFKQVLIPITKTAYFYDGFQFRFRNLSSIDATWKTAGGQWHIDYVRLDYNRSVNDIFSNDIAFVNQSERILKNFQAIPIRQFSASSDLVSNIPLVFRNLDNTPYVAQYHYQIFNQNNHLVWDTTPSNANIYPFYTNGFNSDPDLSKPRLYYQFPNITTPETFKIQHVLKKTGGADICTNNDTMTQTVHFGNFFAYDDGSAEAGFGLSYANGQFAYRFPLIVPDTLVAIQIQFNHTLADMSRAYLKLVVWRAENDSTPSRFPLYAGQDFLPTYNETIGYQTYVLDEPVILPKGSFFIGFQQLNGIFLNIGFDQNNNAENRMFYYSDTYEEWRQVYYYGALMMRPVFGKPTPTGFCEKTAMDILVDIYPNPSRGIVFVNSPQARVKQCEIYDLNGKKLIHKVCNEHQFSVEMPEFRGVYMMLITTEKGLISRKIVRQ